MSELSVLVDVRFTPNSPDIVLVRQNLAVVGGELRLVGTTTESVISLPVREVVATAELSVDNRTGMSIRVRAKNTGIVPVGATSCSFLCYGPIDLGPGLGNGHASDHWSLKLLPMNAEEPPILLPGEERSWYLPTDHELSPFGTVHSLPPESYKIVIYSAKVPVAEVPGHTIKPLLEMLDENPEPQMSDALKSILNALPVQTANQIHQALSMLSNTPPPAWESIPGMRQLYGRTYMYPVGSAFQLILRHHRRGPIELLDLISAPVEGSAVGKG